MNRFLIFLVAVLSFQVAHAVCDQTLSVGANLASAAANAANGSTICLNNGNYGAVQFANISRSSFVTLTSVSGVGAQVSVDVYNSQYIKFSSLTLTDSDVRACSLNIQFLNNTFVPNAPQLLFNYDTACGVSDMGLLVDGNTFDRGQNTLFEGRLSVRGVVGLVITNNVFSNVPTNGNASDGIQIVGGSTKVTVGPGNLFTGILEDYCGTVHCDNIQDYGGGPGNKIIDNYFNNGTTFIMMPDGSSTYTVQDNIFDGSGVSYIDKIQFGSAISPVFIHNTILNTRVSFDSKTGSPASSNVLAQNNILINGSSFKTSNGSGCSNCNFNHNLFDGSSDPSGSTNNLIGSPSFVGGSSPSSWAGFQLTSSSLGYRAASDGLDMGTTYYGSGAVPAPAPSASPTPSPTATPSPTPAPTPTPTPVPVAGGETLMASLVPTSFNNSDGAGVNYELGMKFYSVSDGTINAIRFYKSPSESGAHTGKIYSASGALLASVVFSSETSSGWQQQNLSLPLAITANTTYVVSVNTGNTYYVDTVSGMSSQLSSANLRSIVGGNGAYGPVGAMPTNSWNDSNYFRDLVFVAGASPTPTPTPAPTPQPTPAPTPAPATDTQAPVVNITSPVNGATVARSTVVTIQASASDNVAVTKVEIYVNGTLKCTDTAAPYSCNWSVPRKSGKSYSLSAKAYDQAGNVANSQTVTVTSK